MEKKNISSVNTKQYLTDEKKSFYKLLYFSIKMYQKKGCKIYLYLR